MGNLSNKEVGEIVALDYRAAAVFKAHQIDFCCNGQIPLKTVCAQKGIAFQTIIDEIEAVLSKSNAEADYDSWPIDLLVDYIEKKHHRYVEEKVIEIGAYLSKLCQVHGDKHPELLEIDKHFKASTGDLVKHMKKEELIVFPFVRKMVKLATTDSQEQSLTAQPFFGSIQNPISVMHEEHDNEGERFREISRLSNNYTPPKDACNTYRVTYNLLKEFEADLHLHIHLENNILFPKTIALERRMNPVE